MSTTTYTIRYIPGPGSDWQTYHETSLRRARQWARSAVAQGHRNDCRAYIARNDGTEYPPRVANYENVNGHAVVTFAE